jgi:hypothetical protein
MNKINTKNKELGGGGAQFSSLPQAQKTLVFAMDTRTVTMSYENASCAPCWMFVPLVLRHNMSHDKWDTWDEMIHVLLIFSFMTRFTGIRHH